MLSCFELQDNASNSAVIAELGGLQAAETSLGALYSLLLRQPTGQEGPLAINGWGNLFFARDVRNVLRAVSVHWCDDGWSLDAMRLESTVESPIRDRVFRYAASQPTSSSLRRRWPGQEIHSGAMPCSAQRSTLSLSSRPCRGHVAIRTRYGNGVQQENARARAGGHCGAVDRFRLSDGANRVTDGE